LDKILKKIMGGGKVSPQDMGWLASTGGGGKVAVYHNGTKITPDVRGIDFTGSGVASVTKVGGKITVNITGGGSGEVIITNTGVQSFNGNTGAVQGVSSFNGQTGAVSFHDYVLSFNGVTGAVQGVSSFNGQTGAVSFHDYVLSFNGVTGAVQGLTSLNGKTGAVGISTDRLKGTTLEISGNTLTVGINIYPNGVNSSSKSGSGIDGTDYLLFQEKPGAGGVPGKLFYGTVAQLFNTPVVIDTVQSISTNDYRSASQTLVLNAAFEQRSISTSTVINEILSLIDGGTFA
jgi:hypothetical protein